LFNSDFMQEQAQAFASRLETQCGANNGSCAVRTAWKLGLARAPSKAEENLAMRFLARGSLTDMCLALLNRNEFVYVP
jgi:hypothetical protein